MPAPTSCTVCERPDRERIDVALRAGTPLRSIAKTYSVGRTALTGHAAKHTTAAETRKYREAARGRSKRTKMATIAAELRPIEAAEDVVAELQRLRVEAFGLFEAAKARGDSKQSQLQFAQLVQILDRFGEIYKVFGSKSMSITVDRSTKVLNVLSQMEEADLRALLARSESGEVLTLPEVRDAR